jgi:phosphoglycolate phosphatase
MRVRTRAPSALPDNAGEWLGGTQQVKIRGILFDKDGTIVDYARTWVPMNREAALFAASGDPQLAAELLRAHGQDPESGAVAGNSVLAVGSIADIAAAFAAHLGAHAPAGLTASLDRLFTEGGAKHAVLIPGADRALATLKRRGLRIGVATNDSISGLKASLKRTGVLDLFDFTVGYDSGYGTKPDAGMALAFCKTLGLQPAEIAMVGDAVHDLAMGRAAHAGLTGGVLSGTGTRQQLEPLADLILPSISDLPALPAFGKRWWRLFA